MMNTNQLHCPLCDATCISFFCKTTRIYLGKVNDLVLQKCSSCGFVFLAHAPRINYDKEYLDAEQVLTSGDRLARFRAGERLANIARYIPPEPDRRFLDIGIGDGLLLSMAEKAGYSTFGLDVNTEGAELARQQFGLKAEISVLPLDQAFPDVNFDVIHMNEVIEHIHEPMPILHWCRKHLRKDGCLVIQTSNIDSLASRIKGTKWDYIRPAHCSYFSSKSLTYAVEKAKFKIFCRRTIDWRWRPTLQAACALRKQAGLSKSLGFLFLFVTAIPFGIRRSIIVYAL